MIHPLVPFAIRGAIWYQGESNFRDGMMYHEKMKALIGGWRTAWGQGDFPFYFVQLAPYKYRNSKPSSLPEMWEAQVKSLSIPNTGMAVITDLVHDITDIHPINKQGVGKRLALWALAKTYGRENLVYSGPLFKSMKVEGDSIRVSFNHIGGGLTTRDGNVPDFFEIAGSDKKFVEAKAKIVEAGDVFGRVSAKDISAVKINDLRKFEPIESCKINIVQMVDITALPTTGECCNVPMPDTVAIIKTSGKPIEVSYSFAIDNNNAGAGIHASFYVDGVLAVEHFVDALVASVFAQDVSLSAIIPVSAGTHTVQVFWRAVTGTSRRQSQNITVRELL